MKRIAKISALAGYRLEIEFEDGVTGTVDVESELFGPVFTPLRDEAVFAQVSPELCAELPSNAYSSRDLTV